MAKKLLTKKNLMWVAILGGAYYFWKKKSENAQISSAINAEIAAQQVAAGEYVTI